jgi:hypothetical protein
MPPRVQYRMACLLIRELWVCALLESNGTGIPGIHIVKEGPSMGNP